MKPSSCKLLKLPKMFLLQPKVNSAIHSFNKYLPVLLEVLGIQERMKKPKIPIHVGFMFHRCVAKILLCVTFSRTLKGFQILTFIFLKLIFIGV